MSDKKMTKHQFYFETPLYDEVNLGESDMYLFSGEVDAYSAENSIDTTYKIKSFDMQAGGSIAGETGYRRVVLRCKRKDNDELTFFVLVGEGVCVKVGQWPSLADLQFADLGKKYDKHMEREDLKEFKRAIGLAANGVGVGSFVYLRRIFENLIENTYQTNKPSLDVEEEAFHKLRMAEKVAALASHLPSQLVQMKSVYPILSKGVHELDEGECLAYFKVVKLAIELMLDQKIEEDAKLKRDKDVQKQLSDIADELKSKGTKTK